VIIDVAGVCIGHITLARGSGPVRIGVTELLPHGNNLFIVKVPEAALVFDGFDQGKKILKWIYRPATPLVI
jgi:D-aminopeptidase